MTRGIRWLAVLLAVLTIPTALRAQSGDPLLERAAMVAVIEHSVKVTASETGVDGLDPRVLDAMREVPRHAFVPDVLRPLAYANRPLPLGYDQNTAMPYLIALMTHLAQVEPDDVVYETGTGSGYHAAILSRLAKRVYSVEVVEPLAAVAAKLLPYLGYDEVVTKAGDGYFGWPEHAPFDAIIVKEAVNEIPPPLLAQLKPGGRMVLPLAEPGNGQMLTVVTKQEDGSLERRAVLPVVFAPMQGGERT